MKNGSATHFSLNRQPATKKWGGLPPEDRPDLTDHLYDVQMEPDSRFHTYRVITYRAGDDSGQGEIVTRLIRSLVQFDYLHENVVQQGAGTEAEEVGG